MAGVPGGMTEYGRTEGEGKYGRIQVVWTALQPGETG